MLDPIPHPIIIWAKEGACRRSIWAWGCIPAALFSLAQSLPQSALQSFAFWSLLHHILTIQSQYLLVGDE